MTHPISLYLISGFLGAGKTTFLQRLLPKLPQGRLGLLVNEFGSVGIDGAMLGDGTLKLVEINQGSIFCACLKDGFVRTLKAFSEQPIDHLLIEASGMADPAGMPSVLRRLSPYLERGYAYRGMICLVDCVTFLEYADVLLPVQNQVRTADLIVLNKTDLVSAAQQEAVRREVRALNGDAVVYQTSYAEVPLELLEQDLTNHGREGVSSNTPWNRPAAYTLKTGALDACRGDIQRFYQTISRYLLRMKGFLETREGMLHVDGVCDQLELSPCAAGHPLGGTLVIIGRSEAPFAEALQTAWAENFSTPAELNEE